MNYEICVIGSEAFLFPFLQFGFDTYTPATEAEFRAYLEGPAGRKYGIIYIEDAYCLMVKDVLEKFRDALTPIVVPIGENEGFESYYKQAVGELMEKAIGLHVI